MNRINLPLHRGLLWKEWHSNRSMILAFLGLVLAAYPLSLILGLNRAATLGSENVYPHIADVLLRLRMSGGDGRITLLIVGVATIVGTYLISGILLAVIASVNADALHEYIDLLTIAQWTGIQVVLLVTAFSFTLLFATLTGNSIACVVLTTIFSMFPAGFAALILMNLGNVLGWSGPYVGTVEQYLYMSSDISLFVYFGFADRAFFLLRWPWLLLAGVALFAVTLKIFGRNPMERNGELLMFTQLEPVLKAGVTVCTALLLAGIMSAPPVHRGSPDMVGLIARYLAGGVGGWLITHAAISRSRTVR